MKVSFKIALGVLLCAPVVSFAAFNDVSLQASNTLLSVGGVTLTVAAPDATIQSIVVGSDNFTLTMPGSSYFKITSSDRRNISTTDYAPVTLESSCTDSLATYYFKSPASATDIVFTVTVQSTTCTTGGAAGGGGSPGGGGGGGGGSTAAAVTTTAAKPAATKTAAVTQAVPRATVSAPAAVSAISGNITRALSRGVTNPQVKVLQQILNSDSDTRIAATGVGSPGNETLFLGPATVRAIQKFQIKYALAKPGVPGYGTVGPKTRAKLNELAAKSAAPSAPPATVVPAAKPSPVAVDKAAALQKQVEDAMKQIKALQEQLKKAK